jgi:NodT family efflux transporter outer membrane factor (OMF) lipoprotein
MRFLVFAVLACVGCSAPSVDVQVTDRPLPASWTGAAPVRPRPKAVDWHKWIDDPDLQRIIEGALADSPDVAIAAQRIEMARAGVLRVGGALLPSVTAGAGAGFVKPGRYTAEGSGNATTDISPGIPTPTHLPDLAFGVQASWEIDLWGRLHNLRKSAQAQTKASEAARDLVRTAVVGDLAAAYIELVALDHADHILAQSIEQQKEVAEVLRLHKNAGRANELAIQQFAAELAATEALRRETAREAAEWEVRINVLAGRYPQPIDRNKAMLFVDLPDEVSAGVPSDLLAHRPDLREAEALIQAAKCDLHAAQAAFFPSVTLTAGLGYQAYNPLYLLHTPSSLAYSFAGGLLAPILNRRELDAQFNIAKAAQVQAVLLYQRAVLGAVGEVTAALANLEALKELLALRKTRQAALVRATEVADLLFRAGKASYLELLMTRQASLEAELDVVEVWKRRRLAHVHLYRALGGG